VRRFRPDVVYAHFLVPTGLSAALAARGTPLVVTAHGRDVRNVGAVPGVRTATRYVVRRAATVVVVSEFLRRELEARIPAAVGKTQVVSSGVDLERFSPETEPAVRLPAPAFVCVGSLTERKNPLRLARAFERLGEGSLTFVGDGPLRGELEARHRVVGLVAHDAVPGWLAAADVVCQASLVEPLGQSLLEAMACARSVVATRVGGPPEFVPPGAGVLVDPLDEDDIECGLRAALALPRPNEAAREAAAQHDVRQQARKVEEILERAARGRPA
jgi:glycosyltransferase involved in cell wall biosynthesis